jgi:hypothetical protein
MKTKKEIQKQKNRDSLTSVVQFADDKLRKKYPDIIENIGLKKQCKKTISVQLNDNVDNFQKSININGNRFTISQDIFVGNVDSVCCLATDGEFDVAVTTAHSFRIQRKGWIAKSSYKTDKGYIIFYDNEIDIAIIDLETQLHIPNFYGHTISLFEGNEDSVLTIGSNNTSATFKGIGIFRGNKCIKYQAESMNYGDSGSYVRHNENLIGMHLGEDSYSLKYALPYETIEKVLHSQNFRII